MQAIVPSYKYELSVDGSSEDFKNLRKAFIEKGATILDESKSKVLLKISSNSLMFAMHPFSNDLLIELSHSSEKIIAVVFRKGERTAMIWLFYFFLVLSILICIQDKSLKALVFPVAAYAAIIINSVLPTHPAHRKIRRMIQNKGNL